MMKASEIQPSSGGCVLKQANVFFSLSNPVPAVFGRLCVETLILARPLATCLPAVFGRLCVETLVRSAYQGFVRVPSRLRAAVC